MLKEFAGLIISGLFFLASIITFHILLWGYIFHGIFHYQLNWGSLAQVATALFIISFVIFGATAES
ncbi:MAG: hypothetical protein A2Y82_00740 [Candidatus Buchananbacteria bacterium RBG_13_36_9]|uniref:Uncharacterized protein n=1 Tax=Candidatus Buchananbacteria bacterium RBG_13_36_9 TaxID=1797530 RepID=A0A1G1XN87_9BACT|nr:MAG: hypothetical protein A2Y82_00740 [Candidatus Buchananbacteria bacterium RBG_13_36_9]